MGWSVFKCNLLDLVYNHVAVLIRSYTHITVMILSMCAAWFMCAILILYYYAQFMCTVMFSLICYSQFIFGVIVLHCAQFICAALLLILWCPQSRLYSRIWFVQLMCTIELLVLCSVHMYCKCIMFCQSKLTYHNLNDITMPIL